MADPAVAKGVAAVVTELLSFVRLALLLMEMKRSGEDRLLKGFAEGGLLAVRFCRLLKLGERLEEGCLLLPLCSGWSGGRLKDEPGGGAEEIGCVGAGGTAGRKGLVRCGGRRCSSC